MKTRFTALFNVFALVCTLGFATANAQIPQTINYQGYLTTPSGAAVNGNVAMTLKLYDAVVAGNELYAETHPSVTVANGIFNVQVGSVTPMGLNFTAPYFLGVTVGTDPEMTPRRPLTAAPYAVTAENIAPGGNINLSASATAAGNVYKGGELFIHSTGVGGTFLGTGAGSLTTSGVHNTAVGRLAASSLQGGAVNTALGHSALFTNIAGIANTAIGTAALANATSNGNIAIGNQAGLNVGSGDFNILIGNVGLAADSFTIRLGDPTTHTRTFLSGTVNTAAISSTNGISAATSVVAPKIGANVLAAAAERPVTIQADTSGGGSEWISFKNGAGATKWHVNHKTAGINFAETGIADGRLYLAAGGNVGIGTDTPTKAKLEINGFANSNVFFGWMYGSNGINSSISGPLNLSLHASNPIAADAFIAFSDQRIKRITGRSNAARDLSTLSAIEVTDYTHIDTPQRGDKSHKKVIAQQVETIYPQAVNKITDVVPDIYQRAAVKDGWIVLNANLKKGDRVRLIGKATQGVHEVLEVADGRFRTAFKADSDTIFVYGREVNDFRTVDYEAIAMLNVSATQELHRRVEMQASEIAQLKQQLAQFRDLDAKVAKLMTHLNPTVAVAAKQ